MVSQLEVYYKIDRVLTGLTAQQITTTDRWDSNKTSLILKNFVVPLQFSVHTFCVFNYDEINCKLSRIDI